MPTFADGDTLYAADVNLLRPYALLDGTSSTPVIAWAAASSTGFYRRADGAIGFSVQGIEHHNFGPHTGSTNQQKNGLELLGTLRVNTNTSGTGPDGVGAIIALGANAGELSPGYVDVTTNPWSSTYGPPTYASRDSVSAVVFNRAPAAMFGGAGPYYPIAGTFTSTSFVLTTPAPATALPQIPVNGTLETPAPRWTGTITGVTLDGSSNVTAITVANWTRASDSTTGTPSAAVVAINPPGIVGTFGPNSFTPATPISAASLAAASTPLATQMLIDTNDYPTKATGMITGFTTDVSGNVTVIQVNEWTLSPGDGTTVTPTGTRAFINPITKTWGANINVPLVAHSFATQAAGIELGINNHAGWYDPVADLPRMWGYDAVNLGENIASAAFIARPGTGGLWNAYECLGAHNAAYHYGAFGTGATGFLTEQTTGIGFSVTQTSGTGFLSGQTSGAIFRHQNSTVGTSVLMSIGARFELGAQGVNNAAINSTPFFDFHTVGGGNDFDVRMQPLGGTVGTTGAGTMRVVAAHTQFFNNTDSNGIDITHGASSIITGTGGGGSLTFNQTGGIRLDVVNSGVVTLNGSTNILPGALEIGSSSTVTPAYIDFHSTGGGEDFTARLECIGGTSGTQGSGTFHARATAFSVSGAISATTISPTTKPVLTYSRSTETAAAAALRVALATIGLVTDSTTA